MNKTANYNLNQWDKADRVLMEDFNADNAKIDAALGVLAAKAGALETAKADKTTLSALSGRVDKVAEDGLRLAVGSYTGNGNKSRSINFSSTLGRPPLVFVVTSESRTSIWVKGGDTGTTQVTWSGNTLTWTSSFPYEAFNENGSPYRYFALG